MSKSKYQLFGIPNCDTVKKVRASLDSKKVVYEFIDFKKQPPSDTDIKKWKTSFGDWPVNKKGPTFRKIQDAFEKAPESEKVKLLILNSSAIKRPILEKEGQTLAFGKDIEALKNL